MAFQVQMRGDRTGGRWRAVDRLGRDFDEDALVDTVGGQAGGIIRFATYDEAFAVRCGLIARGLGADVELRIVEV